EQLAIGTRRGRQPPAGESGHDLAQDRGVILGLGPALRPFDSEPTKVLAQTCERPLMQETGNIIRAIGQEFPAPEADEEIEIFALDTPGVGAAGGIRERRVGEPERSSVAAQAGEAIQQWLIG